MASGADTHTDTHTYIRTEVILRNQARAWSKNRAVRNSYLVYEAAFFAFLNRNSNTFDLVVM